MTAPTFGSLFAGVGGFDLGFERAGWECRWQVEWDRRCQSVLARHWPDVARYADVATVDGADLAPVDCITYGFPCQDLSVAGGRAGLDGERSGLFFQATRIIREMREATDGRYPTWAVAENVPGLLSADRGAAMGRCLDELADCGAVGIEWAVLDAQHFGVPQRRRRVFIVAWFDPRAGRADPLLPVASRCQGHPQPGRTEGPELAGTVGPRAQGVSGGGLSDRSVALTSQPGHRRVESDAVTLILTERERVNALTNLGSGGPDDNDAQAGHLIVQPRSSGARDAVTATTWTGRHG